MTAPTPEPPPLDVAELRRLDVQELHADDFDEGWREALVVALIQISRGWPAILAALSELEGLRAALQEIRDDQGRVCPKYATCRHEACQSSYASWAIADRVLCAAREAEEVSGG